MTDAARRVHDLVAAAEFVAKYPYYAAVLSRIDVVADPTVASMGVSLHGRRFYLHVNPAFFDKSARFVRGILLHEVHHVVLGHLTNPALQGAAHDDLMEIAKEISANEWIEEPLPDPITWRAFERWGVRRGQSTSERYDKLVAAREAEAKGFRVEPKLVDDHEPSRRGGSQPTRGSDPVPGLVRDAIAAVGSQREITDGEPTPGLLAGREPGRLLELLEGHAGPVTVPFDWRTALSMFVAARRAPSHRWGRPNRRFPARVGEVPGRVFVSRAIERPRLLVCLDTSMSITDRELAEVARQLRHVTEHADVVVAEIDTEIAHVGPFDGTLAKVHGRGGTDLRPAFEPEFLSAQRVCGVVYFTDGDGPCPEAPPPVPTLWVLTKKGAELGCTWGARAWLVV